MTTESDIRQPASGMCASKSKNTLTFAEDYTLPALPVPTLQATCDTIPKVVAPLVEPDVLAATLAAAAEFGRNGGDGEKLQQTLMHWAAHAPGSNNWVGTLWEDQYLRWRNPIALSMNYSIQFRSERWDSALSLPKLVRAFAHVLHLLSREAIEPEQTRHAQRISMEQARRCVYTRIPGPEADSYRSVELFGFGRIAVVCRGHWFIINLTNPAGDMPGERALDEAFTAIRAQAATLPQAVPVAAMTSAPRSRAAKLRFILQKRTKNRLNLEALEGSLFSVSLDAPLNSGEIPGMRFLAGDASMRWHDKSVQIVCTEDGALGTCIEHGQCDATLWCYLFSQVDALLCRKNKHIVTAAIPEDKSLQPEKLLFYKLDWEISDPLKRAFREAATDFAQREAQIDLSTRAYPEYGAGALQDLGANPDAFLHIATQAAQYSLFGRFRSAYESVSMRRFCQGRTSRIRPCTVEALEFVRALVDGESRAVLAALYRSAETAHRAAVKRCLTGHDIERHMFGLQAMYAFYGKELGITRPPALFRDPGWLAAQEDVLFSSTISGLEYISSISTTHTHKEGFGVFFTLNDAETSMCLTLHKDNPYSSAQFISAFEKTASSMKEILRGAKPITMPGRRNTPSPAATNRAHHCSRHPLPATDKG